MWRISLGFVAHRSLLLVVALTAIYNSIPSQHKGGLGLAEPKPFSLLWGEFLKRVSSNREARDILRRAEQPAPRIFSSRPDPFFWVYRYAIALTGISPIHMLLFLSNFFLLLYLKELFRLLSRMGASDIAGQTCVLVFLVPPSYEMSLLSSLSFTCYLVMLSLRHALDGLWLVSGIGVGLLALIEPMAVGLVPFLSVLFWYFERHFRVAQVAKRAFFFSLPVILALWWKWDFYRDLGFVFSHSALAQILVRSEGGSQWGWSLSQTLIGQTVIFFYLMGGGIVCAISNAVIMHRIIPLYTLAILLLFSPYNEIATRAPIAGACVQGISMLTASLVAKGLQLVFIVLTGIEVYQLFR